MCGMQGSNLRPFACKAIALSTELIPQNKNACNYRTFLLRFQYMQIKVLYEDSNILAINKPSGILVHPAPEHPSSRARLTTGQRARYGASPDKKGERTILDIFRKKYPKIAVVHRLDRETSGVMLLAKNTKAHEFLKKQFSAPALGLKTKSGLADKQGRINKVYHCIVN